MSSLFFIYLIKIVNNILIFVDYNCHFDVDTCQKRIYIILNITYIIIFKNYIIEVNVNFLITENSTYQGYSTGFSSEFNKYEPLSELSDDTYELSPNRTGTYYIPATGYGIDGKIKANWKIQ